MTTKCSRKPRSDKGHTVLTDRDIATLIWIGEQYAIRLDQLQWLLGRSPGRGSAHEDVISESSARDVLARWKRGGWIKTEKIRAKEPFWIWLTAAGLRKVGLPYRYVDIGAGRLEELKHLYAINEVRNEMEVYEAQMERWISERFLARGVVRERGNRLPHRPDAELVLRSGEVVAIEVELTAKTTYYQQEEILLELIKGDTYRRLRETYTNLARQMVASYKSEGYDAVWYFAPEPVKKFVAQARAHLVRAGALSREEAAEIYLYSYPLAQNDAEQEEEESADNTSLYNTEEERGDL